MIGIRELGQKILGLIRIGNIVRPDSDDGLDSIAQIDYNGKTMNAVLVLPYGVSANAPRGANAVLLSNNGSTQDVIAIPFYAENRFRDLKEWEVQIGNYKVKSSIHFKDDGTLVIDSPGNVEIQGNSDFAVAFNDLKSGFDQLVDDFNTHIHATTATVGATSTPGIVSTPSLVSPAPPVPPPDPSTASIDAAKIDNIRVP